MKESSLWTLVWTVSLVTSLTVAQSSVNCPSHSEISPCSCTLKKSGLDIVCEYTDLSHIDDVMRSLKGRTNTVIFYLRLRHNSLPKLQPYVFLGLDIRHLTIHNSSLAKLEESSLSSIGTGLTQLDLSQNSLLSVPSSALKDLQHLLILNLNRNKIKAIHKKAFEGLDTLEILSLYENEISIIEEDAFKGLHKKLRRLNLGGNHLTKVPTQALRTLDMLKKLEMQENRITAIQEGDFEGLKSLDSLGLAHNQLREVPARVFAHLTQLNSLELDGNQITHVDPDAFIGLEVLRNEQDYVKIIVGRSGRKASCKFSQTRYEENVTNYILSSMVPFSTVQMPSFRKIFDDLEIKQSTTPLKHLTRRTLRYFDVYENGLFAAVATVFHPSFKTRWVKYLSSTAQKIIHDSAMQIAKDAINRSHQPQAQQSSVDNFFNFSDDENKSTNTSFRTTDPEIELLQFLKKPCTEDLTTLKAYPTVKKLFLYYNTLLPSSAAVERLFSYATMINLPKYNQNLQYLRLGDNNLHAVPSDALRRLHRLRHLDLKANNITSLPEDAFTGYGDSITFLNLQKNLIKLLPPLVFENLNSLETLNLQNNKLTRIQEEVTENIVDTLRHIDITDNPLICDCELRWYSIWLENLRDKDEERMSRKRTVCLMVNEHREYSVQNIPLERMGCVGKNAGRTSSTGSCRVYVNTMLQLVTTAITML
ncbi:hypothetical protein K0M31_011076 [Melipona bicolor]|uniref:Uncharacterized protein n=1 Tax=Melipona bicolor TaxID=60889 RepID=A0AA40FKV6_9HYME|nr:hypothetical protein K0M31_011076 [Melipona bicolor]